MTEDKLKVEAAHTHRHAHTHHQHDHQSREGMFSALASALHLPGHSHHHSHGADDALFSNELGTRTLKWALAVLGLTTAIQVVIYLASGSVALLADTVHNLGDALNSVPLLIAFALARRPANRRYTYGYGRAEDIAGLLIVVSIAFSAAYILWEAFQKFVDPQPIENSLWVVVAALVGFLGNELVALMQIRVGRRIGSEAMVTDGRHARVDGLTSLAVLPAVLGTWLGMPILDPIFALLIGISIVFITRDAIIAMWYRLMDAVEPHLVDRVEAAILANPTVISAQNLRMRWVGHRLHVEAVITLDGRTDVTLAHEILHDLDHEIKHSVSNVGAVNFSVAPNA